MNGLEWFRGRRCGVTGQSGYIGSRLVPMLREAGAIVEPHPENEACFHLAAQTSAKVADEDPTEDWARNVAPLYALIEEWRNEHRKPFIVFAGSATQVGAPKNDRIHERLRDEPLTTYDLHKLVAEQALEHACRRGWARGTTLRLANVYGPSLAESGADRGVLNRMCARAVRGQPIEVWGKGHWLRDYVFVDDVCRAFMLAAANQETTNGRHFVVGSGCPERIYDAAALVSERARRSGLPGGVERVEPPEEPGPLDTRNACMDWVAFKDATGWRPEVGVREGIDRTVAHYLGRNP